MCFLLVTPNKIGTLTIHFHVNNVFPHGFPGRAMRELAGRSGTQGRRVQVLLSCAGRSPTTTSFPSSLSAPVHLRSGRGLGAREASRVDMSGALTRDPSVTNTHADEASAPGLHVSLRVTALDGRCYHCFRFD